MAPPRKPLPPDAVVVAAVAETGSFVRAAPLLGVSVGHLARTVRANPSLSAACEAVRRKPHEQRGAYTDNYPADDQLLALMQEHRSLSAVARCCGVRRESLRDYLTRRPELEARMRALIPAKLTEAERTERNRRASRDYMRRKRLTDPTTVRSRRRLSMAGKKAPGLKPALDPETNDYARVLRADPCAYCGAESEHIDHIEPVADGGGLRWDNLTAACGPCNRRKRSRSLLTFLRVREEVIA